MDTVKKMAADRANKQEYKIFSPMIFITFYLKYKVMQN